MWLVAAAGTVAGIDCIDVGGVVRRPVVAVAGAAVEVAIELGLGLEIGVGTEIGSAWIGR